MGRYGVKMVERNDVLEQILVIWEHLFPCMTCMMENRINFRQLCKFKNKNKSFHSVNLSTILVQCKKELCYLFFKTILVNFKCKFSGNISKYRVPSCILPVIAIFSKISGIPIIPLYLFH